jgi:hypothetical protein
VETLLHFVVHGVSKSDLCPVIPLIILDVHLRASAIKIYVFGCRDCTCRGVTGCVIVKAN